MYCVTNAVEIKCRNTAVNNSAVVTESLAHIETKMALMEHLSEMSVLYLVEYKQ